MFLDLLFTTLLTLAMIVQQVVYKINYCLQLYSLWVCLCNRWQHLNDMFGKTLTHLCIFVKWRHRVPTVVINYPTYTTSISPSFLVAVDGRDVRVPLPPVQRRVSCKVLANACVFWCYNLHHVHRCLYFWHQSEDYHDVCIPTIFPCLVQRGKLLLRRAYRIWDFWGFFFVIFKDFLGFVPEKCTGFFQSYLPLVLLLPIDVTYNIIRDVNGCTNLICVYLLCHRWVYCIFDFRQKNWLFAPTQCF